LVDIGFFQELSANRIKTGSAKCSAVQTVGVSLAYVKNAPDSGYVSYDLQPPDGRVDYDNHHIFIDLIDLQRNIGFAPHIRDPRMDCNSPRAGMT
jgi:hypothetical protein